jgi:stress-induced morphogen
MKREAIIGRICAAFPDAQVELQDLTGTEDHWQATIVSAAFVGKSPVERHRMVYAALTDELRGPIHALSLILKTP